jgi:hypothetical protein
VHIDGLSSHHTGGWPGPTAPVPVAPVTLHLKPCMYMLGSPQLMIGGDFSSIGGMARWNGTHPLATYQFF